MESIRHRINISLAAIAGLVCAWGIQTARSHMAAKVLPRAQSSSESDESILIAANRANQPAQPELPPTLMDKSQPEIRMAHGQLALGEISIQPWATRALDPHYRYVYLQRVPMKISGNDALYTCVNVAIGVDHRGYRHALSVALSNGVLGWQPTLQAMHDRGVEAVDLFVTGNSLNLKTLREEFYPASSVQHCVNQWRTAVIGACPAKEKQTVAAILPEIESQLSATAAGSSVHSFLESLKDRNLYFAASRAALNARQLNTFLNFPETNPSKLATNHPIHFLLPIVAEFHQDRSFTGIELLSRVQSELQTLEQNEWSRQPFLDAEKPTRP